MPLIHLILTRIKIYFYSIKKSTRILIMMNLYFGINQALRSIFRLSMTLAMFCNLSFLLFYKVIYNGSYYTSKNLKYNANVCFWTKFLNLLSAIARIAVLCDLPYRSILKLYLETTEEYSILTYISTLS